MNNFIIVIYYIYTTLIQIVTKLLIVNKMFSFVFNCHVSCDTDTLSTKVLLLFSPIITWPHFKM